MSSDDVLDLDAVGQAAALSRGDIAATELLEAAIARIDRLDGTLHAVLHPRFEAARNDLTLASRGGRFWGVPLLLKDHLCELAGEPAWSGMRPLAAIDHRADRDAVLTERFREAGFVFLGRTSTSELALSVATEPAGLPATRNPWRLDRSPGGSSGGSAAAVAAGLVAAAHGNDTAGSLRIPASWCGLVGLKPSRGRTTSGPTLGEHAESLTEQHVLCRSVRDTATILGAITGPASDDPHPASTLGRLWPPPDRPARLRVGFVTAASWTGPVEATIREAVEATAATLEQLGHHVEECHPAALAESRYRLAHATLVATHTASELQRVGELLARPVGLNDVQPSTWWLAEYGRELTATGLIDTRRFVHQWARRCVSWWRPPCQVQDSGTSGGGFDLLLTPTVPHTAPPIGAVNETMATTFTMPFNLTGQPAVSLPVKLSDDGLPIGVQLVAGPWREDRLLQTASQLEAAMPWQHQRPELAALPAAPRQEARTNSLPAGGCLLGVL